MKSKQPFKRTDRVADSIRKIVSEVLVSDMHHRNVEGITITGVNITQDLRQAKVFYRVLDLNDLDRVKKNLGTVVPMVRKKLGSQLHIKFTPALTFVYDESLDRGNRIEDVFRKLKMQANPVEEE